MRADLYRFYRIDIDNPGIGVLALADLVAWLPPEAAVWMAANPDSAMWGLTEHLLALVCDYLAAGNWQRGGDSHAQRPDPIPRPGVVSDAHHINSEAVSLEEMEAWLEAHRYTGAD